MDSITANHNNFCQGAYYESDINSMGGQGDYLEWYADACGSTPLGSGSPLVIPAPDSTTTYFARWMNGCDTTECQSVIVNVMPAAIAPDSISVDQNNYCAGTVGFITLSAFGGFGDTLQWFEGECGENYIGSGNSLLINAPTETTTFYARYANNCGPSECTSLTVNVIPQPLMTDSLTVDTNFFCQAYNGIIILIWIWRYWRYTPLVCRQLW
jgi:hypothetical protein